MGKIKQVKDKPVFSFEGDVARVSHIFYMAGKNSKFFFIEVIPLSNGLSSTRNYRIILARICSLHQSILDFQIDRSNSIGKR